MSFEEIYRNYSKRVFNLALQYVQNTEDAEEITQDVFVAIYHALPDFQENSQPGTWVYRIAINKSLDYIKKKKRQKRFAFISSLFQVNQDEIQHEDRTFHHPGISLEQKEAVGNIFIHINSLSDNQKTALILSKLEHKSQKEIAEIMKLSPKAVESLIQRAKNNLGKKLGHGEGY